MFVYLYGGIVKCMHAECGVHCSLYISHLFSVKLHE